MGSTDVLHGGVTTTPLGAAGVAVTERGIRRATLFHRDEASAWAELRAVGARESNVPLVMELLERLDAYGAGDAAALTGAAFDPPPEATEFSRSVWLGLLDIPAGETRTYGWLAAHVGRPSSARAVGRAVGANPIPLWLPCHRVLASDGTLHGFGGGLAMKRALLEHEQAIQPALV